MIRDNCPANARKAAVAIPSKIKSMIERAVIITDTNVEKSRTAISVKEGKMRFISKSPRGEVIDNVLAEGHPEVVMNLDCKNLKSVISNYGKDAGNGSLFHSVAWQLNLYGSGRLTFPK